MNQSVFLAVASMATTALYVSYATPIALGAVARHAGRWNRKGPWHLGRLGVPMAWLAVLWTAFVLVVCALPPNALAGAMLLGVVTALAVLYLTAVRGKFAGPTIRLDRLEATQNAPPPSPFREGGET
jgi:amino acid transporter